ncbi:MAG: hypothetical protein Q8S01_03800, partial [Ignavibacteria bacterium]|nr:hypothetical protein [Ignavibacteria bacterium]
MLNRNALFITKPFLATTCFKITKKISILSQKLLLIVGLVVNLSSVSQSQKFLLTDINSTHFSIDRIAQQIYFKDFYSDIVRKVDLKNMEVINTGLLVLLPIFSNKKHLMLGGNNSLYDHGNKNNYYLYNLDKQSNFIITDTLSYPLFAENHYSFSPNDSNFITIGELHYFSLKDSSLLPLDKNIEINYNTIDAYPQWSSDTSFVFLLGYSVIAEYFLKSKRLDTLVSFASGANITGFAYNMKHNVLAYSIYGIIPQIYFHYKNSNSDSLVFSPLRDDASSPCWGQPIGFTSLTWSPDNQKLAFGVYHYTYSITGIYLYSIDSNRTYKATSCDDYGLKTTFHWANNDTIIYVSETDWFLYGMDLSSVITTVDNKKDKEIPTDFYILNYP